MSRSDDGRDIEKNVENSSDQLFSSGMVTSCVRPWAWLHYCIIAKTGENFGNEDIQKQEENNVMFQLNRSTTTNSN